MIDGVIRRKSKDGKVLIIVPQKLTSRGLKIMHDDQGHFGYFWLFKNKRSQEMYFWPKKCRVCQQRRNPVPANRAPLQPITTRRSGELVTMDIVEYPLSLRGYRYCLVIRKQKPVSSSFRLNLEPEAWRSCSNGSNSTKPSPILTIIFSFFFKKRTIIQRNR